MQVPLCDLDQLLSEYEARVIYLYKKSQKLMGILNLFIEEN